MELREVTMTAFIVLHAAWSVEHARQLVEQLMPLRIIIRRDDLHQDYYLLTVTQFLRLLVHPNERYIYELFERHALPLTPVLTSDADAEEAPDQCIVVEDSHVIGFFDASIPPHEIPPHRSAMIPYQATWSNVH
jgi:hypothetical protein